MMNLKRLLIFMIIPALLSCSPPESLQRFAGLTQGTSYHISFWKPGVDSTALKQQVDQELARLDKLLSNYRPDSVIEQFNAFSKSEPFEVGEEFVQLVKKAQQVSKKTDGCYDITSKPLFSLWAFNTDHPVKPADDALQQTQQRIGYQNLEIVDATHLRKRLPQLEIDIASIAQGYSVYRIGQILLQNKIENYLVEIGGELETRGQKPGNKPWRVAIERPLPGQTRLHKILTIKRHDAVAVMTSGTYRHFFDQNGQRFSHILDARTGRPVTHNTVSVTLIHDDATIADAWSTALLCVGAEKGLAIANQIGIAALFITQHDGETLTEQSSQPWRQLSDIIIQ
ncbi:FAD:protein FMN transferase [methane-oxidizing endosymbiont of Gigantopelta aegis]|uniref:FAD:protein FMN transferase n=1 Tax=methane-oxidizing endosymbiont of Gigantopelta aegis TaxID=2794938 RepID=UPI0018DE900C|nr:FAD:protein FMN transferase [methane-oxidizing endosymbiont of Gigantopelta aegis]